MQSTLHCKDIARMFINLRLVDSPGATRTLFVLLMHEVFRQSSICSRSLALEAGCPSEYRVVQA